MPGRETEDPVAMRWIAWQFASGNAFFAGVALLLVAAGLSLGSRRPAARRVSRVAAPLAALFIVLSATPLPAWVYAAWAVPVIWLMYELLGAPGERTWRRVVAPAAVIAASAAATALEVPRHLPVGAGVGRPLRIVVIGDSLSAGTARDRVTWPQLLADRHGVEVVDRSEPGLTQGPAVKRAQELDPGRYEDAVVVLQIGGNDLLAQREIARFESTLDELLGVVGRPSNTVILLELPLPPFNNAYGRVQRMLAARHGALLAPKRVLAGVLWQPDATTDGIHLSPTGHRLMAETMWSLITAPRRGG